MTTDVRLADLRARLAAREGKPGFEENVRELRREIEALETTKED